MVLYASPNGSYAKLPSGRMERSENHDEHDSRQFVLAFGGTNLLYCHRSYGRNPLEWAGRFYLPVRCDSRLRLRRS